MRIDGSFGNLMGAAFGAALLLSSASASAAGAADAAGRLEDMRGSVSAAGSDGSRPLAVNAPVFVHDRISTGDASRARFELGRETTLRIGENAAVVIDRFLVEVGGVVTVGNGPVLIDKAPGSRARPLKVRGEFGLITVRGTRVWVGRSVAPQSWGVFVAHGVVDVVSGGHTVTLRGGEGTDVAAPGARPTPPKRWGPARIAAALAAVD